MATPFRGSTVGALADQALAIAKAGLAARRRLNGSGQDETHYLAPLEEIAAARRSPAEVLLQRYHGEWNRSVDPVYRD